MALPGETFMREYNVTVEVIKDLVTEVISKSERSAYAATIYIDRGVYENFSRICNPISDYKDILSLYGIKIETFKDDYETWRYNGKIIYLEK